MRRFVLLLIVGLLLVWHAICAPEASATCAKVSIEILQELTIERVAFDAKLVLTNGIPDHALDNIRVDVIVRDESGNVKNDLFFVRPPTLTGISGVLDGSGTVAASAKGEAHWLIIPSPGAGYTMMNGAIKQIGVDYWVGATLSYTVNGTQEVVPISPAKITVKPMPQLVLDYFMPVNVIGDNPFTPQVEPPVQYPLAVRIMNDGYGSANNLRIDSAQPKITDNKQGLLVDFRILGAAVNDSAVTPSLSVNFGNLPSKKGATASWQMISTISGTFVKFETSFTHASELGGDLTSLISATNPHSLTHMVKANLPGRDNRLDFLADLNNTTKKGYIYESEIPNNGSDMSTARSLVTMLDPVSNPVRPTSTAPSVAIALPTGGTGWIYTKMADPSQGLLKLIDVIRADGVHLDPHNFWVDQGLDANYKKSWTLQFVDYRADDTTSAGYVLVYTQPDVDTTAPTSTLIFDGPTTGTNPVYITPKTRLILTAGDNEGGSGVDGMYRKVAEMDSTFTNEVAQVDTNFISALPFTLPANESTGVKYYKVRYYSTDLAGKVEDEKSATVTVVAAAPAVSSFTASPTSFSPQAPKGIAVARKVDFLLTATSGAATLPVEIAISPGEAFQADKVIRTLKGTATPGSALTLSWDGKDGSGKLLPIGIYSAQVKVSDGLDNPADVEAAVHTTTAATTVAITDWFNAVAVDPHPAADQLHPKASGTKVVWQDFRNNRWDIYWKDLAGTASSVMIPRGEGDSVDRQYPAIDGNIVVWQESGPNGDWNVYGFDLSNLTGTKFPISTETGDQTLPVISGNWVVWQGNAAGNWDIYAYDRSNPQNPSVRITNHERDQLHPAISGTTVTWEDYRHGFGEIYQYDLVTRTEKQISSGPADETSPAVSGISLVWRDRRSGQSDIFAADPSRGALSVTYGSGDHSQPVLLDKLLVYTDFESGADDPNLSFRLLSSGIGDRLTADPARQEEPALGSGYVLWQDNRDPGNNADRHFQIYAAPFAAEATDIEAAIKPGFNLVAVGSALANQSASAFIAAKTGALGAMRLLSHDPLHNTYTEATAETDFNLVPGAGLVIYAQKAGTLRLAESGETATYTLLPGTNQIGILTVPFGYGAYDLMKSLGLENVQSVRRFDNTTGAWQTAAVRQGTNGAEAVGMNFVINPGDGLVITMKNRMDGWTP